MEVLETSVITGEPPKVVPIKRTYRFGLYLLTSLLFSSILPQPANGVKCHLCLFHLDHCTNPLDCYNQPDTCSNTNFSPLLTQTVECEFGCEQYVVTDATGSMVVWRRSCAGEESPRSSYVCFSRNIYFMRHEQCWCHSDYCNSAKSLSPTISLLQFVTMLFITSVIIAVYI